MDIKSLNEQLEQILEEQINEMAITKKSSGKPLFDKPVNIEEVIDKCYDMYINDSEDKGYQDINDIILECEVPFNKQTISEPITIIYGSKFFGIKHIFQQRNNEFNDKKKCKTRLNPDQVKQALYDLPNALKNGKVLIDFNVKGKRPYAHHADRLIIYYNELFYIFIVNKFDGITDVTCPLTLFKPTDEYLKLIEQLNFEFKLQNS